MIKKSQVVSRKVKLLELAEQLGNISEACKVMGYSRDSFYRFRRAYDGGGEPALQQLTYRKPQLARRTPAQIETIILDLTMAQPTFGQVRIADELRTLGQSISPAGVRGVWQRHNLETMKKRFRALEVKVASERGITESAIGAPDEADA